MSVKCLYVNKIDYKIGISGPVDVELNVKTVEGLSLDRVYDVIEGSLVAEASTGWIVKLAPGECKVFICK